MSLFSRLRNMADTVFEQNVLTPKKKGRISPDQTKCFTFGEILDRSEEKQKLAAEAQKKKQEAAIRKAEAAEVIAKKRRQIDREENNWRIGMRQRKKQSW
jgi:hypothetical protein